MHLSCCSFKRIKLLFQHLWFRCWKETIHETGSWIRRAEKILYGRRASTLHISVNWTHLSVIIICRGNKPSQGPQFIAPDMPGSLGKSARNHACCSIKEWMWIWNWRFDLWRRVLGIYQFNRLQCSRLSLVPTHLVTAEILIEGQCEVSSPHPVPSLCWAAVSWVLHVLDKKNSHKICFGLFVRL